MAIKRGRTVSAAEKPIYTHLTGLFHQGRVHAFWAVERDDWRIQMTAGHPVAFDLTLDDVKAILRRIDPEGCTWDTRSATKTGKAALLDLSRRLLAALTSGESDERLILEATALISAA